MIAYMFLGKGGVGKTTSSAALALALARRGRTLVISLDPAHNLGDVLNITLNNDVKQVYENLYASEPDFDEIVKNYAKNIANEIKEKYKYLRAWNLDKLVDLIENTPGTEEYAIFMKLVEIYNQNWDYVVVDHAPTGLSVKVLILPRILKSWIEVLLKLRKEIYTRKKALAKLKGEEIEDEVYKKLEEEYNLYKRFEEEFSNPKKTKVVLVLNPEELPFFEAKRAYEQLTRYGIKPCGIVINKIMENERHREMLKQIEKEFRNLKIVKVKYSEKPPRGIEELKELSKHYEPLLSC